MTLEPIELCSPTRSSIVRLTLWEGSLESYPSLHIGIRIEDDGFAGWGTFWVPLSVWEAFLADLTECERTQRGMATLEGIDPGECLLTLESADSLGHFDVHYQMRRGANSLTGKFSLDVEFFGQIVSQFERWDKVAGHSDSR